MANVTGSRINFLSLRLRYAKRKSSGKTLVLFIIALLASVPAAAVDRTTPHYTTYPGVAFCPQTYVRVCNTPYTLSSGSVGNIQSLTLPPQYVIGLATYQCVSNGLNIYYQLVNGNVADCAIKTCPASDILICGNKVSIDAEAKYGETSSLQLPDEMIDHTRSSAMPNVKVQCSDMDGSVKYKMVENSIPSCNIFKCAPATITACNAPLAIENLVPMGTVLDVTTPYGQAVKIECMGSLKGAPHYAVIDSFCN